MRPRYETQEQLMKERLFAEYIGTVKGVKMHKLPDSYKFDYLMSRPIEGQEGKYRGIGMAELKCREISKGSFAHWMVSLLKWEKGFSWLQCGLMVVFFVRYLDGDCYYQMQPETMKETWTEWGGRTKATRDSADIEAVQCIPMRLIKELK